MKICLLHNDASHLTLELTWNKLNKPLSLVITGHMTFNIQSEYFISALNSNVFLNFVYDIGSRLFKKQNACW